MSLLGITLNDKILKIDDDGNLTIDDTVYGGGAGSTEFDSSNIDETDADNVQKAIEDAFTKLKNLVDEMDSFSTWTYINKDEDYTAVKGDYIRMTQGLTVTLPADPEDGDRVAVTDINGKAADEDFIIDGNGETIYGEDDTKMNVKYFAEVFQFAEDIGWFLESTPVTDDD